MKDIEGVTSALGIGNSDSASVNTKPVPNHVRTPQIESRLGSAHSKGDQTGNRLPTTEIHKCPQCHDTCLNAQVLARHIEILHDPSMVPAPPDSDLQQSSPLFFLDHCQRWLDVISNTTSETAPLAKQSLEKTRVLAVETLQSLLDSRCMSHPQYDPETDKSVKELTKGLINTDKLLRNLDQQLLNLIGSGNPENGSLAGWISYQWKRVGYLPDPADIIDDRESIELWLTKVKYKLSIVTELLHSSPPVPREGTVAQEPDKPPLTSTQRKGH